MIRERKRDGEKVRLVNGWISITLTEWLKQVNKHQAYQLTDGDFISLQLYVYNHVKREEYYRWTIPLGYAMCLVSRFLCSHLIQI